MHHVLRKLSSAAEAHRHVFHRMHFQGILLSRVMRYEGRGRAVEFYEERRW